jgi:hypothetical protein
MQSGVSIRCRWPSRTISTAVIRVPPASVSSRSAQVLVHIVTF